MSSYIKLKKLVETYGFKDLQTDMLWLKEYKSYEIFNNIKTYKEGIKDGSLSIKQWNEVIPLYRRIVDEITHPNTNYDLCTKSNFEETIQNIDDIEHTSFIIKNEFFVGD